MAIHAGAPTIFMVLWERIHKCVPPQWEIHTQQVYKYNRVRDRQEEKYSYSLTFHDPIISRSRDESQFAALLEHHGKLLISPYYSPKQPAMQSVQLSDPFLDLKCLTAVWAAHERMVVLRTERRIEMAWRARAEERRQNSDQDQSLL